MSSRIGSWVCAVMMLSLSGCSTWEEWSHHTPVPEVDEDSAEFDSKTDLVGAMAVPFGLYPVKVEAIGLVTGLRNTGSDPKPGPQREVLISEMKARGIPAPSKVIASTETSLVLVRGVMRPGIQQGDHFDIEIHVPAQSDTTSLRGGYLLECRLREMEAREDNQIHQGFTLGLASGPVLVDPTANPKKDRVLVCRGRILSGGIAQKPRPLALVLKPAHESVINSSRIETAINRRFHTFDKGIKVGVAKAKTEKFIELKLHPRYKENIQRYVAVVRSTALRESELERSDRLNLLEKQLLDPITSSRAALQLEAIGSKQAIDVLERGLRKTNPEVRFYSAEAMAYLDDNRAAEVLAEAARNQPAFRVFALTALSAMDDVTAADHLRDLMQSPSSETRYGAFRALWTMNPNDPLVRGEQLDSTFTYHVIDTAQPPMIHVTRNRRAEVVLFGRDQRFKTPLAVEAGTRIMVTSISDTEIAVSRFTPNEADQKRVVSTRVDDVIRAIVDLGGMYPDVVQALQEAKAANALIGRFEVDSLPTGGRVYDRHDGEEGQAAGKGHAGPVANSPIPDLYLKMGDKPVVTEGVSAGAAKDSTKDKGDKAKKKKSKESEGEETSKKSSL